MNQEHYDLLMQDVGAWNEWRKNHWNIRPDLNSADLNSADLSRAELSDTDLSGARLNGADLRGAFLSGADLSGARLNGADLSGAYLSDAYLRGAYLNSADLRGTDLSDTHLNGADLSGTGLSGADLSGTHLWYTVFANNDLSTTKGLTAIRHDGPSIIQLHTVKLPQDGSALHFLRGAGIPDELISWYRGSIMQPIQYHSCFLSYSSSDETLAKRLHADLQDQGVRCWFAPHDLRPGQLMRKGIDEAIHMQDKLLLILSESSVESGWVAYEVETALAKEIRQKREVLFPLRIDEAIFQCEAPWARELREKRHIGDFTQWTDPLHYQQALEHFLQHLKISRL